MKMKKRYWIVLFLLLLQGIVIGQTMVITDPSVQLIGEHVQFLEDEGRDMTLAEAVGQKDNFEPVGREVFVHYATPSAFWFYFSIENQTGLNLWLDIANSNLTYIDLYTFDADFNLIDSLHDGCLLEKDTPNKGYTFQSLIIERNNKSVKHFFMHVETNLVYEVPLFVGSVAEIMKNRNYYDYASVFVVGAFLLMLLYNLFLYLVTLDKIYVYYSLYLLTAIIIGTYLNNFPFIEEFIGKDLAYNYLDTWLWMIFVSNGLFTIRYFDLLKTDRTFYTVILVLSGLFLCFGIANLFVPLYYLANGFQVLALIFYIVCLLFSYRLLFRGVKRARLYCVGWTFMMIGAILYLLVYNGLIPYNPLTRNIAYVGSLVEILIFSIALGTRITDLQRRQALLNNSLIQKNRELIDVNDSLDSFNYHVSHDLKTVLNNTLALSRMARKYNDKKDTARVDEIISKLENVAINGSETVQSFLSLGRLDTILKEVVPVKINLANELGKVLLEHNLVGVIQVKIEQDQIKEFRIHSKAFESIFINFLTNSIKYNQNKPKAWIKFTRTKKEVVFSYRDNGVGIDLAKYGADLFKPFQRAGADEKYEGTGVGLYLVKRIVTSLGGTIQVQSELNKGTEFIITFNEGDK